MLGNNNVGRGKHFFFFFFVKEEIIREVTGCQRQEQEQ
jgi:hypothetical protein